MPTKPVTRGSFVRNIFASVGAALGGIGGFSLLSGRKDGAVKVAAVREPRNVARRDS